MNADNILTLYKRQPAAENFPEIDAAIKWYLDTYIPRRIDEAHIARSFWTAAAEAAEIEHNPRKAKEAEKALDAIGKAVQALEQERNDWRTNGGIFLL